MKKTLLSILILIFFLSKNSGQIFQENSIGKNYFMTGTKLLHIGDYKGADSILTLALCSFKDENVYYNRGAAKLFQKDTVGFCEDISIAANRYFDQDASRLFNDLCCEKVDTIFYDVKENIVTRSKYRYYEVIKYQKYIDEVNGTFHDTKAKNERFTLDFGCELNIIGMTLETTDIIAVYKLSDTTKYYYRTPNPISIINQDEYNNLKNRAKTFFNVKYSDLKTRNNLQEVSIYYEITFSKTGEILDVKYKGIFPEVQLGEKESELEKDLLFIVNRYPKVSPAKFKGKRVNFVAYDLIVY
jgi:hypothetical protein